jgi:hypothetical protein
MICSSTSYFNTQCNNVLLHSRQSEITLGTNTGVFRYYDSNRTCFVQVIVDVDTDDRNIATCGGRERQDQSFGHHIVQKCRNAPTCLAQYLDVCDQCVPALQPDRGVSTEGIRSMSFIIRANGLLEEQDGVCTMYVRSN